MSHYSTRIKSTVIRIPKKSMLGGFEIERLRRNREGSQLGAYLGTLTVMQYLEQKGGQHESL